MVQLFDDPNLELDEIAWFHILSECMIHTYKNVQGSQKFIKLKKGRDPLTDENEYMSWCYRCILNCALIMIKWTL